MTQSGTARANYFKKLDLPETIDNLFTAPHAAGALVLPALLLYSQEMLSHTYPKDKPVSFQQKVLKAHERMTFEDSMPFVLSREPDNDILAVASLSMMPLEGFAHLNGIAVPLNERGQGHGKEMMKNLFDIARQNGCYRFELMSMYGSVGFYEKLGFERVDSAPDDPCPCMGIDL